MNDDFWSLQGPGGFPAGPFDPDASLNFSWNAGLWIALSGVGLTLDPVLSTILVDPTLTLSGLGFAGNVMTCRITRSAQPMTLGDFAKITVRMFASDGQHDDRTFYLQLTDR